MNNSLGIDVAKLTLDVALNQKNRMIPNENTPEGPASGHLVVQRYCQRAHLHGSDRTIWRWGRRIPVPPGLSVSVVNPARIKHYGNSKLRRNKTDKADAQLIAEFCYRETPAYGRLHQPVLRTCRP